MAPATRAGATPNVRHGRPVRWTRETIIEAIREWAELYGEPPRAADWNPGSARWSAATWRIERYRRGRPDGTPWPSLNRAKAPFGGSLNAALQAAGFEPNRPGPRGRGVPAPVRPVPEGPAGPAVLARALRALAAARREGSRERMVAALGEIADAAIAWRERL